MTLRRRIFLFIVFLCSSVVLSLAQPKLEVVGGTHYDLGIINEGVVVTRRVVFKNTGTDSLRIDSITTSCGCTLAKPSSNVAASGDSLSLTITFDTKNLSGPVRKHIFFYTNDSEQL
ncbi:MAG TPA: DUF1573 domain-containing protein, partial [Bacteroidota bacterium]|nr:DUF1573 domain-containing protein [Bacteroidota bacterium]